MAETRKYTRAGRRNIINANNIINGEGEYALVCAPIGALEIARVFLRQRGLWRTTYAISYGDNEYTLPDDDDMAIIEQVILEFLEATNDMNCNDLITELSAIEQAISALASSGGCGCGSAGQGATEPPVSTEDTGDITSPTGTPPDGYASWEDYQESKCDIATWLVNSILGDINNLAGLSASELAIVNLGVLLTVPIAGAVLAVMYTALLTLVGWASGLLGDLYDELDTVHDDLICTILEGETATESKDNFTTMLDSAIDTATADTTTRYLAKLALHYMVSNNAFNLLYAPLDDVITYNIPPGQDCTDCGIGCHLVSVPLGTDFGTYLASEYSDGYHRLKMNFNATGPASGPIDCCGEMELVTVTSQTGYSSPGTGNGWAISEDNSPSSCTPISGIYTSDTPSVGVQYCCRQISIKSNSSFTVTIERAGKCTL